MITVFLFFSFQGETSWLLDTKIETNKQNDYQTMVVVVAVVTNQSTMTNQPYLNTSFSIEKKKTNKQPKSKWWNISCICGWWCRWLQMIRTLNNNNNRNRNSIHIYKSLSVSLRLHWNAFSKIKIVYENWNCVFNNNNKNVV